MRLKPVCAVTDCKNNADSLPRWILFFYSQREDQSLTSYTKNRKSHSIADKFQLDWIEAFL